MKGMKGLKGLLLIAHGSRNAAANAEIFDLVEKLRAVVLAESFPTRFTTPFNWVECAFLEMASPDIGEGAAKLIGDGAREIVVLPYFLAAGNHVAADIPAHIAQLAKKFPQTTFTTAAHFGATAAMPHHIAAHLMR